jgi:NADPH:quinone reductase-like Zn-dependent oxidoreductase
MKTWVIEKESTVENIIIKKNYKIPEPNEYQVRIKVLATSLNPVGFIKLNKIRL